MNLYDKMALFRDIGDKNKKLLFFVSIYNDMRFLESDKFTRFESIKKLIDKYPGLIYPLNEGHWLLPITETNWKKSIFEANKKLAAMPEINLLMKSFILNRWLSFHGLCPFVHYAFSKWVDIRNISTVIDLAELSTTYLYKLIANEFSFSENSGEFIGEGAYGKVYLTKDKKSILKYPKNMAALKFMHNLEISVYDISIDLPLIKYLAPIISFDVRNSIIEKKYIEGVSGWELLENESFRKNPYGVKQLKEIYKEACGIYFRKKINIDIHPGNFQWNHIESKWYLIDYGSMPEIGADYFPRDSFENYFKKIWLDLHQLIKDEPIRSLDIDLPLPL